MREEGQMRACGILLSIYFGLVLVQACRAVNPADTWVEPLDAPAFATASQGTRNDGIELSWARVPGSQTYLIQTTNDELPAVDVGNVDHWLDSRLGGHVTMAYTIQAKAGVRYGNPRSVFGYRGGAAGPAGGGGGEGSWPCLRGNTGHSGLSPYLGPGSASMLWESGHGNDDEGWSSQPLVASDGTVYLPGGSLVALNRMDGSRKWRITEDIASCQLGEDGRIYGLEAGRVVCFRPDGALDWVVDLAGLIDFTAGYDSQAPGGLYANGQGVFYYAKCSDLIGFGADGAKLWQIKLRSRFDSGETVIGPQGELIFRTATGISAVGPAGNIEWSHDVDYGWNWDWSAPLRLEDGRVLFTKENALLAVSAGGVETLCTIAGAGSLYPLCRDERGTVFTTTNETTGTRSSIIRAINPVSGSVAWEYQGSSFCNSAVFSSSSQRLFVAFENSIEAFDRFGAVLWKMEWPSLESAMATAIALAGEGILIVPRGGGRVLALRDATGAPPAPQGLYATQGAYGEAVSLHWEATPGALGYEVYRAGGSTPLAQVAANTRYLDLNPPLGELHYQVAATNAYGRGALSAEVVGYIAGSANHSPYWPQQQCTANRANHSAETGPLSYNELWRSEFPTDYSYSSDIFVGRNGMVYLPTSFGLYAFDANGHLDWILDENIDEDSVMIDAAGRIYWRKSFDDTDTQQIYEAYGVPSSYPFPAGGRLVAIGSEDEQYIYTKADSDPFSALTVRTQRGEIKYQVNVLAEDFTSSVDPSGRFYYKTPTTTKFPTVYGEEYTSNKLLVLDDHGAQIWQFDPQSIATVPQGNVLSVQIDNAPFISDDGTVYLSIRIWYENVSTASGPASVSSVPPSPTYTFTCVALNPDGSFRWKNSAFSGLFAQAANHCVYALGGLAGTEVYCINPDGVGVWETTLDYAQLHGAADSMISDAGYNLFVKFNMSGQGNGAIVKLSPSGELLWNSFNETRQVEWGQMALGRNGTLYYLENDGPLIAVGP
jgi:hypothetical protein